VIRLAIASSATILAGFASPVESPNQRRAAIDAPMRICGLQVGKAEDELARLRQAEDVDDIRELDDVININQNDFERWWTFTKPNHPAYPALVCSWPRERDGLFDMGMDGKCGLDGDACMAFFGAMKRRNAELTLEMRALRAKGK
jgi:hypothetical protein